MCKDASKHPTVNAQSNGFLLVTIIILAVSANTFAVWFVTQERFIYFWDWALYWMNYSDFSRLLAETPGIAMRNLYQSIQYNDYNLLPVLPLSPFAWLFGTGRLPYVLAITNIALLPSVIALGLVVQQLVDRPADSLRSAPLLLASATILLLPAMWAPLVRGWPDILGLFIIALILLQLFSRPPEALKVRHYIVSGLLLCLLVLLRRWYLFWVVAFFPTFVLALGIDSHLRHGFQWRRFLLLAGRACIAGLVFALALFIIAKPFLLRAVQTDYSDIYSAYRFADTYADALKRLLNYFGWVQLLAALAGIAWLVAHRQTRAVGIFLLTQAVLIFLMFTRTQDFATQHHYLLMPAIGIGTAVLVVGIYTKISSFTWRAVAIGSALLVLLAGFVAVFVPGAAKVSAGAGTLLPKVKIYPFNRNDLPAVSGILEFLEQAVQEERGQIYVLASSSILNSSIFQNACSTDSRPRSFCACIDNTNDVDKRDGFPNQFLQATYVVLATPTQYHLRQQDQRVIGLLARDVRQRQGIGTSFERISGNYSLDRGVSVTVFKKARPFSDEDLDSLFAEFRKHYPGRQEFFSLETDSYTPRPECRSQP